MNEIFLFTLISCTGMFIQSFVGFAGSLFAIPLFSFFLSPREAVPIYNLVMLFVNIFLVIECFKNIAWKRVGKMLLGGIPGIPLGAYILATQPIYALRIFICVVSIVFALLFLFNVKMKISENIATSIGIGFLSGLLGGSISESGPPVVIFGLANDWKKDIFRATLLAYFLFLSLTASLFFMSFSLFSNRAPMIFVSAAIPTLLFAILGIFLKNKTGEKLFRYFILTVIILVSLLGLFSAILARGE
ncbi:MAG: sulfite exporter TauE/SafE family protein [bacterium]|nr:sulfite exporter TauE/SafE family protein [bacterium]